MSDQLSPRERDILRLLGAGRTTHEIADELGIAESSVIWYARRVVQDVGMRRTDELARRLAHERERRSRLRRGVVIAAAVVLLLALGAIAVVAMTRHDDAAVPSAPTSGQTEPPGGTTLAPTTAPSAATSAPLPTGLPQPTLAPVVPLATPLATPPGISLPPLPTLPLPTPRLP